MDLFWRAVVEVFQRPEQVNNKTLSCGIAALLSLSVMAEKAVIYVIRFSVLLQHNFLCFGRCIRRKETGSNCKIKFRFFAYLCLIDCYTLTYQRNQRKMCHIYTSHSEKQSVVVIDKQKWNITGKSWVKPYTQINRIMLCCCYMLNLERPAMRF